MAAPQYWTAEMVRALPDDGKRYETVYGELLVSPSPGVTHQNVLARLFALVDPYATREGIGRTLWSPADISWKREDVLVQPDLFVVPLEQLRSLKWSEVVHLRLAVEVLSPSSTRQDRFTKRRLYQEMRVEEYWVVDTEGQAVEVWTPNAVLPRVEERELLWQPQGAAHDLRIDLSELFRPL